MDAWIAVRVAPLVAAVVWVARGEPGDAVVLGVLGVAAVVLGALRVPRFLDVAFLAVVTGASVGVVAGLYEDLSWYDTVVHALAPVASAPIAYLLLVRFGALTDPAEAPWWAVVLVCTALGAAMGAAWELMEWTADSLADSRLQESLVDTNRDLLADLGGAFVGGLLLARYARAYGHPTTRGDSPARPSG